MIKVGRRTTVIWFYLDARMNADAIESDDAMGKNLSLATFIFYS